MRPGSRIRVRTAVMSPEVSKPRANAKVLSLLRLSVLGSQIFRENSRNSTAARSAARVTWADRSRIRPAALATLTAVVLVRSTGDQRGKARDEIFKPDRD